MSETICPTCGAKCRQSIKKAYIETLPQPDLAKLRKALDRYRLCQKQGCVYSHDHTNDLALAVKELLEENK